MNEFYHRDLFGPVRGVCSTENSEVGFKFLVDSFGFSISLGVVSRR